MIFEEKEGMEMASEERAIEDERAGAEIVTDPEVCVRSSLELLDEIGFPRGVLPLKDLVECGRVRATGFVWMKQRAPSEHYFEAAKSLVSYAVEVTGYVEKHKMTKMTGVKTKPFLVWIPVIEMRIEGPSFRKIYFKTSLGVGRYYSIKAFMTEEDKKKYGLKNGQTAESDHEQSGTAAGRDDEGSTGSKLE